MTLDSLLKWRYIPPFSASGSIQMAVDSWLFHQCLTGDQPPTLRFYTWVPVTLSLGYFQKKWPTHWANLTWQRRKLTLVRRPTGGRGVLHHGDLTYSLTCPMNGYTRPEAYRFLCQFLIQGWQKLGIPLNFGSAGRGYHQETNCFRLSTSADLVCMNGKKFIGSAQLWRGDTVLQHGSMALNPDISLQAQVFKTSSPSVPSSVPWVQKTPTFATIIETLKQSAAQAFEVQFKTQPLSAQEWEEIQDYIPSTLVE